MENRYKLYFHLKKSNKDVFYVGIGNEKRPFDKKGRTVFWRNVVNKHGYEVQIIKENLTWEQACVAEIFWIKTFGRRDRGEGELVNLTDGGDGNNRDVWNRGVKLGPMSEEQKAKRRGKPAWNKGLKMRKHTSSELLLMSITMLGKNKRKHSEEQNKKHSETMNGRIPVNKGQKISDEIRSKISKALKGKTQKKRKFTPWSEERRAKHNKKYNKN